MIRIDTSVRRDWAILSIVGRIEHHDLPELKRVIERHKPPVILDLKGVTLVDREVVTFLADFETESGTITSCPTYIREWIRREQVRH